MDLSAITSFLDHLKLLSNKNSFEAETFESEPTFENNINEIKSNNLKDITSIEMNVSAITSNNPSLSSEHKTSKFIPCIHLK